MSRIKTGLFMGATLAVAAALTMGAATLSAKPTHAAKVGEQAPDFTLTDTDGKKHTLSEYTKQGKIVVLEWFNPGCPFVIKHHHSNKTMATLANEFSSKNVVWIAVNSGAAGKQGHGLETNKQHKTDWGIAYPILMDESGDVGRTYEAKTTPHMYIIDKNGVLQYAGAIDNNRSATTLGDVNYVRQALNQIIAGETVTESVTQPYGCSVKY